MKNSPIPLTPKEIEAIQAYTGYEHMKINWIADMHPKRYENLRKKLGNLDIDRKRLKELIEKFVAIYSAIYKQDNIEDNIKVYKGTSKQEANQKEGEEIKGFLSTTDNQEIAKQFGDCTIIFTTKGRVPYYSPEKIKAKEKKKNEEEMLLLPFTKVVESKHYSQWDNRDYYTITIEKEELPKITTQEIETMQEECLNQWEEFQEQMNQLQYLEEKIEELVESRKKASSSKEIKTIYEEEQKTTKKSWKLKEKLEQYSEKFTRLLKTKCKQKEIEIDKKREEIEEAKKQEEERKQEQEIQETKTEIQKLVEELKSTIDSSMDALKKNVQHYQELAKRLDVPYTQTIEPSLWEKIEQVKEELDKKKELSQNQQQLQEEKQKLEKIEQYLKITLANIISNQEHQSNQEIKYNLNIEVTEKLATIKKEALNIKKDKILAKKDSIWQRILGRNPTKQEELKNVEARIHLVEKESKTRNPENSVEDLLENMYETAYQYLDGEFTQEMLERKTQIRENFKQLPEEQEIEKKVKQKLQCKDLTIMEPKKEPIFFKKQRILALQNDTKRIVLETQAKEAKKMKKEPTKINFMAEMETKMEELLKDLRVGTEEQREKKEKEEGFRE